MCTFHSREQVQFIVQLARGSLAAALPALGHRRSAVVTGAEPYARSENQNRNEALPALQGIQFQSNRDR